MSNYPKHHQQRRPGSGKSRPPAPPPPPPPSRTRPFPNNATPNGRMCHESQGATPSSASQPQSGVNNRYSNGNTYEVYQIHQPLGIPYPVTSRHGYVLHQLLSLSGTSFLMSNTELCLRFLKGTKKIQSGSCVNSKASRDNTIVTAITYIFKI